jgi:microtubule-associated protein-like 6
VNIYCGSVSRDGGCVKLWDQEMKRCRAFQLGKDVPFDCIVKSVSRSGRVLVD